ncbi:MAG TPA: potassium/proton antiporter [Thermoleophilaceae bacterium]
MHEGELILVAAAMLAAGLGASLMARRLRMPSLLLFLAVGMAVGSEGTGWLPFDDYELARAVGVIALSLILFEGGMSAGFAEIRPVLRSVVGLALVGTLATAAITGLAAAWLFNLTTLEGLLLGAVVSATDGAAIFALLRNSTLERRLARTLEGESGMNDPIAVLLVLGFIEWIEQPDYGVLDMAWLFVEQLGIGVAIGILVGGAAVWSFKRAELETAGLYPVASLATAGLAFGAADTIGGSGFLAVYLAGLIMGSAAIPAKRTIVTFHQGLAWVAQIAMFLTLGLLVFPTHLGDVLLEAIVLTLILVFFARPVAVFVSTPFDRFNHRERLLLGWAGLRGAVPVVLATFPVIADVPNSVEFFNIVFFAVVISTLLQGATFEPLARRLDLTTSQPALPSPLAEAGTIRRLGAEVLEYPVGPEDAIVGHRVRDLGLPREAVVNVIVRGDEAIPPRGSTRLRAGDRVHVLMRREAARRVPALMAFWRDGPIGPRPRPPRTPEGREPIMTARPWREVDGDPAHPGTIADRQIIDQLRVRRDRPGGLFVLDDGRYALAGPVLAVGGRTQLSHWCRRRMGRVSQDERAWLQTVIGALATEVPE